MVEFKELKFTQKKELAQKIIDSLDGLRFYDAQQVLSMAVSSLETSAVVRASQVPKESDEKR